MEHFPAGDLRTRMKAHLTPDTALDYLDQIASALQAIHAVGVLHRDLKPANVMLRIGWFAVPDRLRPGQNQRDGCNLTGTREIFGTPYYMSPEQGHAELIDVRSDLYSLGVVFYEMLTGRKPYTGASAMEVIYKHKRAELPEIPPQFSGYAADIRRLLAKSPADRLSVGARTAGRDRRLEGHRLSVAAAHSSIRSCARPRRRHGSRPPARRPTCCSSITRTARRRRRRPRCP